MPASASGLDGDAAQLGGRYAVELALEGTDGGALGAGNDDLGHVLLRVEWVKLALSRLWARRRQPNRPIITPDAALPQMAERAMP